MRTRRRRSTARVSRRGPPTTRTRSRPRPRAPPTATTPATTIGRQPTAVRPRPPRGITARSTSPYERNAVAANARPPSDGERVGAPAGRGRSRATSSATAVALTPAKNASPDDHQIAAGVEREERRGRPSQRLAGDLAHRDERRRPCPAPPPTSTSDGVRSEAAEAEPVHQPEQRRPCPADDPACGCCTSGRRSVNVRRNVPRSCDTRDRADVLLREQRVGERGRPSISASATAHTTAAAATIAAAPTTDPPGDHRQAPRSGRGRRRRRAASCGPGASPSPPRSGGVWIFMRTPSASSASPHCDAIDHDGGDRRGCRS